MGCTNVRYSARLVCETRSAVCETAIVRRVVTAKRADVVERSHFTAHDPIADHEIGTRGLLALRLEHSLIKAGRQGIDQIDIARKLVVLLSSRPRRKRRCPNDRLLSWTV